MRKLKLALESRIGTEVTEDSNVMQWMICHAAYQLTKFSIGHDGMTAQERLTGRKWRTPMVEFGEVVLAKLAPNRIGRGKKKQQKSKLAARSIRGVWVGQLGRTGEHVIVKQNGDAVRCRTIRRVPIEDRWDAEFIVNIEAIPRLPAPSQADPETIVAKLADEESGHRARRRRAITPPGAAGEGTGVGIAPPEAREGREPEVRRFRINESLLAKYGFSDNCAGCEWKSAGNVGHREHSAPCRERLRRLMLADEQDAETIHLQDVRMNLRVDKPEEGTDSLKVEAETEAAVDVPEIPEKELTSTLKQDKLDVIPEEDEEDGEFDDDVEMTDADIPELNDDNVCEEDLETESRKRAAW